MFKNVIQSISKSLKKQVESPKAPAPAEPAPAPAAKKNAKVVPLVEQKPAAAVADKKKEPVPAPQAPAPIPAPVPVKVEAPKSPEDLCGVEAKMNKDQVKDRLKLLYRRYNRAASSLDSATRAEAERMMDAIVSVREKHFGEI